MDDAGVLVLGSINTDLVIKGNRLPTPSETVMGGEFYQAAGGKGANQAVAAARAGNSLVTLIGAVGDDEFGRQSLAGLKAANVCCDYIKHVSDQPSGVALIMVDKQGENHISVAPGANLHLTPADVDRIPEEVFERAKVFMACLEVPLETVLRGFERAKQAGLRTILNPAPARGKLTESGILPLVDILTPNEIEIAILTDDTVFNLPTATAASEKLMRLGADAVIVTLGSMGSVLVEKSTCSAIDAIHVVAYDTTAAGDAYNGTLAVALAEGRELIVAARWANAAATISVTRLGAQPSLPHRWEIEKLVQMDMPESFDEPAK